MGEACGLSVEQVTPQYTGQRCSTCGFTHEDNHSGNSFCCQDCGYENHADYNAARNIGLKLLRSQTGSEGGAPVSVRVNSGMVTTNGVVPVLDSVRVGIHAECHGL
jgi:putative transposase